MMPVDAEQRRLHQALASVVDETAHRECCPSLQRIWDAVRCVLPPHELAEVVSHSVECPPCGEAWRLAKDVVDDVFPSAATDIESATEGARQRPGGWFGWWGVAAAAATLAIGMIVTQAPWFEKMGPPAYRAPAEEQIRSLVATEKGLPRDAFVLRWTGPADARYDIRVATEQLETVSQTAGLATASYRVPETVLAVMPAGTRLLWRVEAVLPGGERMSSRTFIVRLQEP